MIRLCRPTPSLWNAQRHGTVLDLFDRIYLSKILFVRLYEPAPVFFVAQLDDRVSNGFLEGLLGFGK